MLERQLLCPSTGRSIKTSLSVVCDPREQLTGYLEKRIFQYTNRTTWGFSWGRSQARIVSLCDEEAI